MDDGPVRGAMTGYEPIDETSRKEFMDQGFLLLPRVLTEKRRRRLEAVTDRVYAQEAAGGRVRDDGGLHLLGFVGRDPAFTELLTHPATFPYVWGLLGWNIYTHHNHLDVTPPTREPDEPRWGWHQDGYRQNSDPEPLDPAQPRPMLSLKIGFVLSDLTRTGRGGTKIIPGSHLWNSLPRPPAAENGYLPDPEGAVEVTAEPGDAFLFDRRLWHSRSPNRSAITRKVLFIGYTYRWIRPFDQPVVDPGGEWTASLSPLHRQLLGDGPSTASHWGVGWDGYIDESIPLRGELRSRGLLDRSVPWLR